MSETNLALRSCSRPLQLRSLRPPIALLLVAVLAASLQNSKATGMEAGARIRGVSPAEHARYDVFAARGTFRCFADEAHEGVAAPPLPLSSVNDDFCDCRDGSDEPGTGACAGQKETLFYCPNQESQASFVYASRVNDGICDCCDGSDEWRATGSGACSNTCAKEGVELRRELHKKAADWSTGATRRKGLIEAGKQAIVDARTDLAELHEKLPALQAEANATRTALEDAKLALMQEPPPPPTETAKKRRRTNIVASDMFSPVPDMTAVLNMDSVPGDEPETAAPSTETPEAAAATDGDSAAGAAVSEYTKWMDGADKVLPVDAPVDAEVNEPVESPAPEAPSLSGEEDDQEEDDEAGLLERLQNWISRKWASLMKSIFGKPKTPRERELDAAQTAHDAAKEKADDAQSRITTLEGKEKGIEDEVMLAYASLDDRCLEKKLRDYNYKACFFNKADQDGTSIGNWKHWESSHVGLFDGGQYCHGGPDRSLRVKFECGGSEEILEVSEPSRCSYEAKISHPAACVGDGPSEASMRTPRTPTEEL